MLAKFSKGSPRAGQWCKFKVRSESDAAKLVSHGSHVTPDGYFVGIFAARETTPTASITRKDGTVEKSGGEVLPDRVVLQANHGHDVETVFHNPKTHGNEMRRVWFRLDGPDVVDLHPMTDKGHFPPGYVARTFAAPHEALYVDPVA